MFCMLLSILLVGCQQSSDDGNQNSIPKQNEETVYLKYLKNNTKLKSISITVYYEQISPLSR